MQIGNNTFLKNLENENSGTLYKNSNLIKDIPPVKIIPIIYTTIGENPFFKNNYVKGRFKHITKPIKNW